MSDGLHNSLRWIRNEPAVVWMCPRCGDMECVMEDDDGETSVIGPQCWQCGATKERGLVEKLTHDEPGTAA
jgi:hypothetical protein